MYLQTFDLPIITSYFDVLPVENDIFYKRVKFDIHYDRTHGYIYQKYSKQNFELLSEIYRKGSTVYNTDSSAEQIEGEHLINRKREFLQIFLSFIKDKNIQNLDILEIGCGPAHFLYELKKLGANVLGCDAGPFRTFAKQRYDIEIVNSFFSDDLFPDKKFDIVFSQAFFDQVYNPVDTLKQMKKLLKKDGKIITAVRDFSSHLEMGNPLGLNPEHTSYFTKDSLENLYKEIGLINISTVYPSYGLGIVTIGENNDSTIYHLNNLDNLMKYSLNFVSKTKLFISAVQNRIDSFKGKTIGIMGGNIETANLLSLVDFKNINIKIYEYDKTFINKYISSVPVKISDEKNLISDAIDEIWIVPIAFADKIEKKIIEQYLLKTPIFNFKTILNEL